MQVFIRLDIGHKDFFGEQFVNCRPFKSQVRMDFVFFIPPPPFFEGTRADFDVTLDSCWYGRVLLLFRIRVKTEEKDRKVGPFCLSVVRLRRKRCPVTLTRTAWVQVLPAPTHETCLMKL
jgi:hypothetical protein